VDVDAETAAAIVLGADDIKARRAVMLEEAQQHLKQWLSRE